MRAPFPANAEPSYRLNPALRQRKPARAGATLPSGPDQIHDAQRRDDPTTPPATNHPSPNSSDSNPPATANAAVPGGARTFSLTDETSHRRFGGWSGPKSPARRKMKSLGLAGAPIECHGSHPEPYWWSWLP
jgi:hypothetical protein